MLAVLNSLPLHSETIQDNQLLRDLAEEVQEPEVKLALMTVAGSYTKELQTSRQVGRPLDLDHVNLTLPAVDRTHVSSDDSGDPPALHCSSGMAEANPAAASIHRSLAEQFRDPQAESIEDAMLQVDDPVELERVVQKSSSTNRSWRSIQTKYRCANCIQKQLSILANIDKQRKDEAASPLVRKRRSRQVKRSYSLFFVISSSGITSPSYPRHSHFNHAIGDGEVEAWHGSRIRS
jgi:hypothetical protein